MTIVKKQALENVIGELRRCADKLEENLKSEIGEAKAWQIDTPIEGTIMTAVLKYLLE